MAPPGSVLVSAYALSDVGRTREHNEDAFVVADLGVGEPIRFDRVVQLASGDRGTLFMVADGMGGAAAGEVASEMAVEVVLQQVLRRWRDALSAEPRDFVTALKAATETANTTIHRYAADHPELRGMGTTATIAGLLGDTLYLAQVGDSRAYLLRDGVAQQITKDQSLMQKLIEAGEITQEEAEQSDRRNIILQALGPESAVKIDLTHQTVRRGDVLVLCSDGLSGLVRADQIAQVLRNEPDLDLAAARLVDLANSAGGPDNITVVTARFDGVGLDVAGEDDQIGHRQFRGPGFETPITPVSTVPVVELDDAFDSPILPPLPPPGPATPTAPALAISAPNAEERRRARGRLYLQVIVGAGLLLTAYLIWRWWPIIG